MENYSPLDYLTLINEKKINLSEYMKYLHDNKYYTIKIERIINGEKINYLKDYNFYTNLICENAIKLIICLNYCNYNKTPFRNEIIETFISNPKYFKIMQVKVNNYDTIYSKLLKLYETDDRVLCKLNAIYKLLNEIKPFVTENEYCIISKNIKIYKIIRNSYYILIRSLSSNDFTNIINVSVGLCSLEYNGFQEYIKCRKKKKLITKFNSNVKNIIEIINYNIIKEQFSYFGVITENSSLNIKNTVDFIVNHNDLVYIYFNFYNVKYILLHVLIRSVFYSFAYKKNFSNIIIYDMRTNTNIKISILNPCIIYDLFTKLILKIV